MSNSIGTGRIREIVDNPYGDEEKCWLAKRVLELLDELTVAEHQLYMAELAKHNLRASRKAQFKRRRLAEKRIAELEARTHSVKLPSLNAEMFNGDVMFGYRKAQKEAVEFCAAAGIKLQIEGE